MPTKAIKQIRPRITNAQKQLVIDCLTKGVGIRPAADIANVSHVIIFRAIQKARSQLAGKQVNIDKKTFEFGKRCMKARHQPLLKALAGLENKEKYDKLLDHINTISADEEPQLDDGNDTDEVCLLYTSPSPRD